MHRSSRWGPPAHPLPKQPIQSRRRRRAEDVFRAKTKSRLHKMQHKTRAVSVGRSKKLPKTGQACILPAVDRTRRKTTTDMGIPKTKASLSLMARVNPVNVAAEKARFFSDTTGLYNPQFLYSGPLPEQRLRDRSKASTLFFDISKKILAHVVETYGSYEVYDKKCTGDPFPEHKARVVIQAFMQRHNIPEDAIRITFSPNSVANASMTQRFTGGKHSAALSLRTDTGRHKLSGLLNHEIGTHYLRTRNNLLQTWRTHKRRKQLGLRDINPTEEGLACLHTHLHIDHPVMWQPAILYYLAVQAMTMSFRDLYDDLAQYVTDKEHRFRMVLRVKRGLRDSGQPGTFCKDQMYLHGSLELLRLRRSIDFRALYLGKIDYRDLDQCKSIGNLKGIQLPWFLEDLNLYQKGLDRILSANGLTDWDLSSAVAKNIMREPDTNTNIPKLPPP